MEEKENNDNLNRSPVTRWFRNAILGATMADLPAMMTASGWRLNEKGDYILDQQNNPYVKLLRDNLAVEGIGVMGEVVDLMKPSGDIPVKSLNIFHPEMIDKNTWKLKAPDWNDKNVFKTIIPGISVYGTTSTND